MLVYPDQHVRLSFEMRDDRSARGTIREMFQKCRGDVHVLESAAGLRLGMGSYSSLYSPVSLQILMPEPSGLPCGRYNGPIPPL
jgi:hypothetical protein